MGFRQWHLLRGWGFCLVLVQILMRIVLCPDPFTQRVFHCIPLMFSGPFPPETDSASTGPLQVSYSSTNENSRCSTSVIEVTTSSLLWWQTNYKFNHTPWYVCHKSAGIGTQQMALRETKLQACAQGKKCLCRKSVQVMNNYHLI